MALEIDLTGKVALVTGAAGGIGLATVENFMKAGANVIAADLKVGNADIKDSSTFLSIKIDVSNSESVSKVFESIKEDYKQLDILVNCAGITRDNFAVRMKEEDFDAVIDVNLKGTFLCCVEAFEKNMMKQKSGSIVNLASVIGVKIGNIGQVNYAASKSGVVGLTKSLCKEFAKRGVRVNAVCPGYIETPMTEKLKKETKEGIRKLIPMEHLGKPEQVADLIAFLASKRASYITGEAITIDGGLTA